MYQCVSDRFDTCRRTYSSPQVFLDYCKAVFGTVPNLVPAEPGADAYYDGSDFVLVKLREGDFVQAMGT